ncbi:anti-sigma factor domain-containing protein [Garicola koreensis]|uniref:Regulator of SigK n=1 Tax=Garicola koreensis TaxID=1262554 RepID=A0A7W5XL60_9MICC|nr:anti-sigma factor [Garicola koreensis]MBB3667745.1 hypothetical protein [Garicola koreensis]
MSQTPGDDPRWASSPADPQQDPAGHDDAGHRDTGPDGETVEQDFAQEEPSLADLLAGTARGETASFSAFFESTADVVYGLALLVHADADGARTATVAVYQHLWDQADARARDLRLQSQTSVTLTHEYAGFNDAESAAETDTYRPNEYELVLEWLVPLTHRIFVERFREGIATPIPLDPVPQDQGGVAGLPEEVLEDLLALSDSQAQSVALTYLAGLTHQQVAERVGAAVPSVKSRLRDAMTRMHAQRSERRADSDPILRAAVTREDVARSGAVNRNFTNAIAADLDKGLLVELAELYALDGLDDRERALLDERALTAEPGEAQQWETRVLAARRTLSEIFAADPVPPPSHLLDEVLHSVGDQEVGVGLVEEFSNHTGEEPRRRPVLKRWMFIAGFLLVLLVGGLVIWQVSVPRDIEAVAEADPQAHLVQGYEMADGGQVDAVFSQEEDLGYVEFNDVPELDEGATYQVWLLPTGTGSPSSVGNFTAEELQSENLQVQRLAQYRTLMITVESIRGLERPQGDTVAEFQLR